MAFSRTLMLCLAAAVLSTVSFSFSEAREFEIDGRKNSWAVPASPDEFNKWASRNRFQIGDSIALEYDGKTDSVLEVTEDAYRTCNTSNPIKSYKDGYGNTKIVLDRSGAFFFISGAKGHCEKGQKLEIEVLSAKHSAHGLHSPAPSPAESHHHHAPGPAPANGGDRMRTGFVVAAAALVVGFLALV